jgi:uncharacterized protein YoaH (UPF0181 family)
MSRSFLEWFAQMANLVHQSQQVLSIALLAQEIRSLHNATGSQEKVIPHSSHQISISDLFQT